MASDEMSPKLDTEKSIMIRISNAIRGAASTFVIRGGAELILPVAGAALLWELIARSGLVSTVFFPPPSKIVVTVFALFADGRMQEHLIVSMQRVALGFLIGAVPGAFLGLMMGWVRIARVFLDPIISIIYPIPRIAILPLFLIIFGLGSPPIIAISALICFFPATVTTYGGVKGIDPNLPLMGRNMGASRMQLITKIAFPAALPGMFAGLRLALGVALTGEVAAEFVAATTGLGAEIWHFWQIYRIVEMYGFILVVAVIGILLAYGLLEIQRRALSWAEDIDIMR